MSEILVIDRRLPEPDPDTSLTGQNPRPVCTEAFLAAQEALDTAHEVFGRDGQTEETPLVHSLRNGGRSRFRSRLRQAGFHLPVVEL